MKHLLISFALLAFWGTCSIPALCADSHLDRAVQLFQDEKNTESLQAVQDHLLEWPNDPRGMFLRALILERMGQAMEAMEVYQELIRAHPEFPEPYNNLAGLLAAQGRYDEAKEILQQALQTHPSYAAAHQNLSKIYSAMASQAYRRVLGAEGESPRVSLESLEELSIPDGQTLLAYSTPSRATPAPPINLLPEAAPAPEESPADREVAAKPRTSSDHPERQPPPELPLQPQIEEQQPVSPKPPEQPDIVVPHISDLHQHMQNLLREWAKAWASQDGAAYLSFYSSSFIPERGLSHQAWREQRQVRVSAPRFINITLSEVTVSQLDQDLVQVHFSQHYRSNTINDQVRKELLFKKENGQWRIIRERLLPR